MNLTGFLRTFGPYNTTAKTAKIEPRSYDCYRPVDQGMGVTEGVRSVGKGLILTEGYRYLIVLMHTLNE